MTTILTWCEDCGSDMHQNGGRSCRHCGAEFCYDCIKNHERYCMKKE